MLYQRSQTLNIYVKAFTLSVLNYKLLEQMGGSS